MSGCKAPMFATRQAVIGNVNKVTAIAFSIAISTQIRLRHLTTVTQQIEQQLTIYTW